MFVPDRITEPVEFFIRKQFKQALYQFISLTKKEIKIAAECDEKLIL